MANTDPTPDQPPSMSAAELRRRLLASTPPPVGGSSSPVIDLDALAGESSSGPPAGIWKQPPPGAAPSRLTMPSQHGPVAASSLPPVSPPVTASGGIPLRSRLASVDPAAIAVASVSGGSIAGVPSPLAAAPGGAPAASAPAREPTHDDVKRLKHENRELRKLLEEMKQLLQEASDNEQQAGAREQEISAQLQVKQRHVDELTNQMQAIEEQVASGALAPAPAVPKTRTELEEWADELERESARIDKTKRQLDDERKQLRDDEEALEGQMRQMEVSMARERALMARQEVELKRLSAEIQHELELIQRGDTALRDQLSKFQRRAADVMQGKMNANGGSSGAMPPPKPRR